MGLVERSNQFDDAERLKFEMAGDKIKGIFVQSVTITDQDGSSFKKYIVQREDGKKVSFLGCFQLDEVLPTVERGTLVQVELLGKKRIKGGKTVKNFSILVDDEGPKYRDKLVIAAN